MLSFLSLAICVSWVIVRGADVTTDKVTALADPSADAIDGAEADSLNQEGAVRSESAGNDDSDDEDFADNVDTESVEGAESHNAADSETQEEDSDDLDAKRGSTDSPEVEEAEEGSADSDTDGEHKVDDVAAAAAAAATAASDDDGDDDDDHTVYLHLSHKSAAAPKVHIHIRHQMRNTLEHQKALGVWVEPLSASHIQRAREITDLAASVPNKESGRCQQYIAQKDALRLKINVLTNKMQELRVQLQSGGAVKAPINQMTAPTKPQGGLSVTAGNAQSGDTLGVAKGKAAQTPGAVESDDATSSPTEDVAPSSKPDATPESESEAEDEDDDDALYWLFSALLLVPCLFLVVLVVCYCRNDSEAVAANPGASEQSEEHRQKPSVREWNDGTASRAFSISGTVDAARGAAPAAAVGGSTEQSFAPSNEFGLQRGAMDSVSSVPSTRPYQLRFSFENDSARTSKSAKGRGGKTTY